MHPALGHRPQGGPVRGNQDDCQARRHRQRRTAAAFISRRFRCNHGVPGIVHIWIQFLRMKRAEYPTKHRSETWSKRKVGKEFTTKDTKDTKLGSTRHPKGRLSETNLKGWILTRSEEHT